MQSWKNAVKHRNISITEKDACDEKQLLILHTLESVPQEESIKVFREPLLSFPITTKVGNM